MPLSLSRTLAFGALAATSMLAGYLAARSGIAHDTDPPTEDVVGPTAGTLGTVQERPATIAAADAVAAKQGDLSAEPRSIIERINELAKNDRFGIRRYQYSELIGSMTAEEASLLFAELKKDRARKDRDFLMHAVFNRWGEVAGETALNEALALGAGERAGYSASALSGWSKTDPETAWQRTVALADEWPAFAGRVNQVMYELVRSNLHDALSRRDDISNPSGKRAIQRSIIEYAAQEGQLGSVLSEVFTFDSIEDQKSWTTQIFTHWGQSESDAPLRTLSSISNPALAQSAMGGFLSGWSQVDPLGAANYALENAGDPAIEGNLANVVRHAMVGADRERIVEVIEQVAATGKIDQVAPVLVPTMGFSNPEIALDLVNLVSDEEQQNRLTGSVLFAWVQRDYEAAVAHFEQMPSASKKRMSIHAVTFGALPREDGGTHISRWVREIPQGEDRTKTVEMLLSQANYRGRGLSDSSKTALLDLVRETPKLSDQALKNAEKVFGAESGPRSTSTEP